MRGEEILSTFYDNISYKKNDFGWQFKENLEFYKSKILAYDIMDPKNGKILITKGTKVNQKIINQNLDKYMIEMEAQHLTYVKSRSERHIQHKYKNP